MNDSERGEFDVPVEHAFAKLKRPHCVKRAEKPQQTASSGTGAANAPRRTPGLLAAPAGAGDAYSVSSHSSLSYSVSG